MLKSELQAQRLNSNMKVATDMILEAYSQHPPIAILLCGGYGRGEGAWYLDENGEPHPYNDYDFAVIADYKLDKKTYSELRKKIADAVDIQWIDIAFYKPSYFRFMQTSIKNVDLVYASKLLYGNNDILKRKNIHSERIGQRDIAKLYKTRIWTFLGSWEGAFDDLSVEKARFFKNQMAKGILAACDMLLISINKYTPSYSERVDIICSEFKTNLKLCNLARWAINEKLHPSSDELTGSEMEELYWNAKDIFMFGLRKATRDNYKNVSNPEHVKKYIILNSDYILHFIYEAVIKHSNFSRKDLDIFIAQCYVFWANDHGTINESYLNKANLILRKWGYISEDCNDWHELRCLTAAARNNI